MTTTNSSLSSSSLPNSHDVLVSLLEQRAQEVQAAEHIQRQQVEQMISQKRAAAAKVLQLMLERDLSPELHQSLGIDIVQYMHSSDIYTFGVFFYLERRYYLSLTRACAQGQEIKWVIESNDTQSTHQRRNVEKSGIPSVSLQGAILDILLDHRKWVTSRQEAEARRHQEAIEYQRLREQQEAEEQQRLREKQAHLIAEDARLQLVVEQEKQRVLQSMWQWPLGFTITFYRVEWCKGSYVDDEGDPHFDYEDGYSLSYEPNGYSFLHLEPMSPSRFGTNEPRYPARTIRLISQVHKPTFQRIQCSSIHDVPQALRLNVEYSVPNVAERWVFLGDDEKKLFVEEEGSTYTGIAGQVPIQWIQKLADEAYASSIEEGKKTV